MAFLSGVLSNIQGHLGQHKNEITEAIETLKQNKHLGKNGFNDAIVKVVEGVRGYNESVEVSNESIRKPMTEILVQVGDTFKREVSKILPQAQQGDAKSVETAKAQVDRFLQQCQANAEKFNKNYDPNNRNETIKNAINDLNNDLSLRVKNSISNVKHESERLAQLSERQKDELEATLTLINTKLGSVKNCVTKKIDDDVTTLVSEMKKKVSDILKQLKELEGKLKWYIDKLQAWIKEADKLVQDAMKEAAKIEMGLPGGNNEADIKSKAEQLKKKGTDLYWKFYEAKDNVGKNVTEALGKVKEMDEALKGDLFKVKKAVEREVEEIRTAIGELGAKLGVTAGRSGTRAKSVTSVVETILDKLLDIKGSVYTDVGLEGINNKVLQNFATKFAGDKFKNDIVPLWIKRSLENQPVKGWIDAYVWQNAREKTLHSNNVQTEKEKIQNGITEQLKHALNAQIDKASIRNVDSDASGHTHEYVKDVRDGINRFLADVDKKFQSETLSDISKGIVKAIEQDILQNHGPSNYADYLQGTIECAIVALVTTAKDVVTELEWLAIKKHVGINGKSSVAEELARVLNVVNVLYGNLEDAASPSQPGSAKAVDTAIEGVTKTLNDEIGATNTNTVTLPTDDPKFQGYRAFVKQDAAALKAHKDGLKGEAKEGSLPAAIGEIKKKVEEDFEAARTAIDQVDSFNQLSEAIKKHLSDLSRAYQNAGKSINVTLNKLKADKIGMKKNDARATEGSLQEIQQQLNVVKNFDLDAIILAAKNFPTEVNALRDTCIKQLKSIVDEQVKDAICALTTHARKTYVESIKWTLLQFAGKISGELHGLPEAIEKDLEQGHKKFMSTFGETFVTQVKGIKDVKSYISVIEPDLHSPLSQASEILNGSFQDLFKQVKLQQDLTADLKRVEDSSNALTKLLSNLTTSEHFNQVFSDDLEELDKMVCEFKPSIYGEGNVPSLLNALKKGMSSLIEELKMAYVRRYSGRQWYEKELGYYAKIMLCVVAIVYDAMEELKNALDHEGWESHKIYNASDRKSSLLALFFSVNGYDIGRRRTAERGELNHREGFNGSIILDLLTKSKSKLFATDLSRDSSSADSADSDADAIKVDFVDENGIIRRLYRYLRTYFSVCHLIRVDKPKVPSSVYEMLSWCCGLQFNVVYNKLKEHVKSEFMKDDKQRPGEKTLQRMEAYPSDFEHTDIDDGIYYVSSYAHAILTAILGHGHKDGIYACEFSNNSQKLEYPTNMIQLLCRLHEVLQRLYQQLYFLFMQCSYGSHVGGWMECHFGRGVGGSAWSCNDLRCDDHVCPQNCKSHATCGIKSPLQSYLEDGLQGFLPHNLDGNSGKLSCPVKNHSSGPCKTPMGFNDIFTVASHKQTGRYLRDTLADFCGKADSPLTRLCNQLSCLLPSAPKTLPDLFSFYYNFVYRWEGIGREHRLDAFTNAVSAANFEQQYEDLNPATIFGQPNHVHKLANADLYSLICNSRSSAVCGPYLQSINQYISGTFSKEHADKYLSWIVYLTETFYDLLKELYDACNKTCGGDKPKCRVARCVQTCNGNSKSPGTNHRDSCQSIVTCRHNRPTMYQFGFIYGNVSILSDKTSRRTCNDFCNTLDNVLQIGKTLHTLAFVTIPKFLYDIRQPFIWLNVALWLLSLLYLIHIMVIRLDLLHIKSHLHSPSSHRIAAQSLLAAGRVNKLGRVFYLQP